MTASDTLPWAEGVINILTTLVLLCGKRAINARNLERHKVCMGMAVGLGVLFLAVFFLRQGLVPARTILDPKVLRYAYWALLIIHLPAATLLPFLAAPTVWFALRGEYARHRPLARILFPLWMVSNVTGIIALVLVFGWGVPIK